jgi:hypothetical protein
MAAHARRPLDESDPEDWEAQQARQLREDAEEIARRNAGFMTYGQAEAHTALLRDILAALKARQA